MDPDHSFDPRCPLACPKPASSWEGSTPGGTSISPCSYGFACRTKGWEFTPQPSAGSSQAVCSGVLQLEAEEKAASTGWQQRTWNGEAPPGARCRLADTGPMCPAPGTPRHQGHLGTEVPYRVALLVLESGAGSGCGAQFWRRREERKDGARVEVRGNLGAAAARRGVRVQEVPEQTW